MQKQTIDLPKIPSFFKVILSETQLNISNGRGTLFL